MLYIDYAKQSLTVEVKVILTFHGSRGQGNPKVTFGEIVIGRSHDRHFCSGS